MLELIEVEGQETSKDLVEVVRCRNCKYSEEYNSDLFVRCNVHYECTRRDDFCSKGVPKLEVVTE